MDRTRSTRRRITIGLSALVITGSCATDEQPERASTSTTTAPVEFVGRSPTSITEPSSEGRGIAYPQPSGRLPDGYTEEELFVGGTATRFEAVEAPANGRWHARPAGEADYRTRVIVRRPPAERFSGTVVVEWFNVSAIEASPDWAYLSQEIGRAGHAYIGVSAQSQGVEGGDTILGVDVDADSAAAQGVDADASGLKNIDAERYGELTHPGDAYAFDIFTQVGRAATERPEELLAGLVAEQVLGLGESQSAMFLTTLVNAVHPLDRVFDGFLIHSRGANIPPLDGDYVRAADSVDPETVFEQGVLVRTDLEVPVFVVESETDLTLLGYSYTRQPDTELIRTWEVAGTAHADAHQIRSVIGGPRDPGVGSLIGCVEPINAGPHHEVLQAALSHLVGWSAGGDAPPAGKPLELAARSDGGGAELVRDELGIALGGIRTPLVDVPAVVYSGDPPPGTSIADLASGDGDVCVLFGRTSPLDRATLVELHGTFDGYLGAFRTSAAAAVAAGFLLQADADELIAEAETNASLFG